MQAVILAAGQSSRFYPFNTAGHKSFVSLLGKPIIQHTLESIARTPIKKVIIVVKQYNQFCKELEYALPHLSLQFVEQEEANGMGDALLKASEYITEDFFLIHAHHVEFDHFYQAMTDKRADADGVLLAREDTQLHKYGVLKIQDERVVGIVEKPAPGTQPSNLRLLGVYLLPKHFLAVLKQTPREHYDFEKALSSILADHPFHVTKTSAPTVTLKYPWELFTVSHVLLTRIKRSISAKAVIAASATVEGDVFIEEGAVISDGARIKGPAYIGRNTFIGDNSIIRNFTVIEEGCVVGAYTEIRNSIFLSGTKIHSGFVGDSIVGENVRLAAAFHTANRKLDRSSIHVTIAEKEVDTELSSLGAMIGDDTRVGIRVTTMPGVIIGTHVSIGPATTVMKSVADNTKYYTVFKEIIEKRKQ